MKKLMFAALAVAGMSAFAAENFVPKAVEKVQLSFKKVSDKSTKIESVKYNGFVFWKDANTDPVAVIWNKKDQLNCATNVTAFGKSVKLKKVSKTVDLGKFVITSLDSISGGKKQGKGISFGENYKGYGSGSCTLTANVLTGDVLKLKESISGNMVNQDTHEYGTWKLSFDKSTTKNIASTYKISDVLIKNKVEFWDFN